MSSRSRSRPLKTPKRIALSWRPPWVFSHSSTCVSGPTNGCVFGPILCLNTSLSLSSSLGSSLVIRLGLWSLPTCQNWVSLTLTCLSMPSCCLVSLLLISNHLSRSLCQSITDSFSRSTSSLPLINTTTWQAASSNKSVHISTLDACTLKRSQLKRHPKS